MTPSIEPITRNLYREEEVVAALRLAVARGRTSEAVFWVQEGLDSDMDVEILQTLLSVWLYTVGISHMSWLSWFLAGLNPAVPFTEEAIVALTVGLVNAVKGSGDSTVFAMLAIGMEEGAPTDHVGFTILPVSLRTQALPKHETTFARAVQQGKFALAWKLGKPLWATGRAAYLLEELGAPQFHLGNLGPLNSEEFVWPFRALSLLIANSKGCLAATVEPCCPVDPTILAEWTHRKTLPMRSRRLYTVPHECLYSYTARGAIKMNRTTDKELRLHLEESMVSSTFWNRYEDVFTCSGASRERFYETYFPTDTPDEWSAADRAKSHGFGALPVVPCDRVILLERCLARFYRVPSKGIWGGLERAIGILVGKNTNESVFHEYYSGTFEIEKVAVWDMSPMKKELEVMCD